MKNLKRKISEFEYWPAWIFYAPFVPYWIWKSIQSLSFSYFCKVNPGVEFGGFLNYSKFEILNQIPEKFKPETHFIKNKSHIKKILPNEELDGAFPFIVKPDFGERGRNVELIKNETDWENYPLNKDLIIQEFIDFPLEFGVFYAKMPNENSGKIISITGKEFLTYRSDGRTPLRKFIENHPRTKRRKGYLNEKFKNQLDEIPKKNEKILLELIGNHNRGTRFYDASELISKKLSDRIDEISKQISGFYYGRFDVKANSAKEFQNGEFKVLEVNGANSEPTHIYDSKYTLTEAYKEVKKHFDIQYRIARQNPKTYSSIRFYRSVMEHIFKLTGKNGRILPME